MPPKKRKHAKVDLTKQKVQYIVEINLACNPNMQEIKKQPQLVKINYPSSYPQNPMKSYPHFSNNGKLYNWPSSSLPLAKNPHQSSTLQTNQNPHTNPIIGMGTGMDMGIKIEEKELYQENTGENGRKLGKGSLYYLEEYDIDVQGMNQEMWEQ